MRWHHGRHLHAWIGLFLALFVLWLAGTGLLIEYSPQLGLDRSYVRSTWILSQYGIEPSNNIREVREGNFRVVQADERLFLNEVFIGDQYAPLRGAVEDGEAIWVATRSQVLMLDNKGAILDQMDASTGLPVPIRAMGRAPSGEIVVAGEQGAVGLMSLAAMPTTELRGRPVQSRALRADEAAMYTAGLLHWERVVLDAHGFRFFGGMGAVLLSISGLSMVLLALTGLRLFALRRHHRGGRHRYGQRRRGHAIASRHGDSQQN